MRGRGDLLGLAPVANAGKPGRHVLARGLWLKTERCGGHVLRSRQWWCPRPLGDWLLARLVVQAERFQHSLPLPSLRVVHCANGMVVFQQYVVGATPLRCLTARHLADPRVIGAVCRFWEAVERCWQTEGWLPDIGGRVYLPWELYRPLQTDNVVVDFDGRCWLVDAGASAVFHSARSPFGRLHAASMVGAMHRCAVRLGGRPMDARL